MMDQARLRATGLEEWRLGFVKQFPSGNSQFLCPFGKRCQMEGGCCINNLRPLTSTLSLKREGVSGRTPNRSNDLRVALYSV